MTSPNPACSETPPAQPAADPSRHSARNRRPRPSRYRPLGASVAWAAVALLVLGLASLAIPVARFGDIAQLPAFPRAGARLPPTLSSSTQGLDPSRLPARHLSAIPIGEVTIRSPANISWSASPSAPPPPCSSAIGPMQVWMTRYFKSLDQEEITVSVHPETGQDHRLRPHHPGEPSRRRPLSRTRPRNRRAIRRHPSAGIPPPWT